MELRHASKAFRGTSTLLIIATCLPLFFPQVLGQATETQNDPSLAAAIVAGLAFLGAGIGLGIAGAAAIGAVSEKPEMFSLTFVYIVFVEAIAVYGFVLAFLILLGGI
jgi:V/A-type H+-transporting ATPase subunit K